MQNNPTNPLVGRECEEVENNPGLLIELASGWEGRHEDTAQKQRVENSPNFQTEGIKCVDNTEWLKNCMGEWEKRF